MGKTRLQWRHFTFMLELRSYLSAYAASSFLKNAI
jgi:hypothetical protein